MRTRDASTDLLNPAPISWFPPESVRIGITSSALNAVIIGVIAFALPTAETVASPATPSPDVPAPAVCMVAPLSLDDLNAAIVGAEPPPAATPQPGRGALVPEGRPVSPATEQAVRAVVSEYVACQNAGELLRAYALYSDAYIARLFFRQGAWDEAAYLGLATPMPNAPGEGSAIVGIRDARLLPDGRVGATVTIAYPSVPMPKRFFFTFIDEGDRWAIDDILGEISFSVP